MTAEELLPLMRAQNADLLAQIAEQTKRGDDLEAQLRARVRLEREQAGAAADLILSQGGAS